ncbi:lysozyme [Brachybacterium sp. P6-10-X1]|uniref:glycoside hydrolase family 25 protein n=1 Tax=Brachybacterium sp. P6-10-X1 TaxID=1903186 RepID=UPI000971A73E|nr:GH25 family lysozyme [Brachybacterium sp. P6-10-X1]APX33362.1 lysozyme [Brachybacterium sp. P6-10-X1]
MPRFTPEQVRRRQIVAGALAVILIVVLGGCTAVVIGAVRGGGEEPVPQRAPFEADDAAMEVATTGSDARAVENLPGGITLGEDEVMGIDVSSHQDEIDWEKVASDGFAFAYIKATEGAGYTDPSFAANWDGASAAGITPGAYHYFTLCSSGEEQAEDFLAAAPPDDSALPPALDLEFDGACEERPGGVDAQAEIDAFTAKVEEAWGRRLLIYSSSEWRSHYGLPVTEPRPDWLFSAGGRPPQADWAVWQLRFDGAVSGIEGGVDIDVARIEQLREGSEIPEGGGAIAHEVGEQ